MGEAATLSLLCVPIWEKSVNVEGTPSHNICHSIIVYLCMNVINFRTTCPNKILKKSVFSKLYSSETGQQLEKQKTTTTQKIGIKKTRTNLSLNVVKKEGIAQLPPETQSEIVANLQGDSRTLFACLQVSRAWCRQVVPVLWSCPLRFGCVRENSSGHFIESLLACLDIYECEELQEAGIKLGKRRKPFFEYVKWIREFDFRSLDIKVSNWYYNFYLPTENTTSIPDLINDNQRIAAVTTILTKLIFTRSAVLTSFWLTKRDAAVSTQSLPDFTTFNGTAAALRRLERVYIQVNFDELDELDAEHVSYLLSAMKVECRHIQSLEVCFTNCSFSFERQVADLIRLQKGLRHVTFDDISSMQMSAISALASQANTLSSMEFKNSNLSNMSLGPISKCLNLDTLVFDECEEFPDEFWIPLLRNPFRLRKLHFRDNLTYGNKTHLIALIQRVGPHLRELQLLQTKIHPELLHAVATSCPNFTHLDVVADTNDPNLTTAIQHVLSRCDQLSYFSLRVEDEHTNCDELLLALMEGFPHSVRHVNLYIPMTPKSLSNFLHDCGRPLRKIGLHQFKGIPNENIQLLADYAMSEHASKDLIIGIDDFTLLKCDEELLSRFKSLCKLDHVQYCNAYHIPSF
ncbi:13201_t:CDS:2 [Ambispora leptoticha]|uniref:13201_t:CDS:1 n=1 Tax=Ambispora leptoticha TaxID=144679 RepID=A0A9N9FX33_9GLOM|nr:13201_t:CDS:2 [Ambispora leptoticha]